ncbi:hypothetical protein TYRP_002026 [Tyrophagus putrescentiae]|nr:hypothetical protein TYRP_002026 [Tyrophagus putrescentiae]
MAGTAPCAFTNAVTLLIGSICSSLQRPGQPGDMRPRLSTPVASIITTPAPPMALAPRWTRCHSLTCPSTAEYMHIGEMTIRFRSCNTCLKKSSCSRLKLRTFKIIVKGEINLNLPLITKGFLAQTVTNLNSIN